MNSLWALFKSDPTFQRAVLTSLAAGLLGFLGSLATVFVTWFSVGNKATKKTRELDLASKRVTFWDAWLKATDDRKEDPEVLELRAFAKNQILNASRTLEFSFAEQDRDAKDERERSIALLKIDALPRWRRVLLLYRPSTIWQYPVRLCFYAYCLFCVFIFLSCLAAVFIDAFGMAYHVWLESAGQFVRLDHRLFNLLWHIATNISGRAFKDIFYSLLVTLFFMGITFGMGAFDDYLERRMP